MRLKISGGFFIDIGGSVAEWLECRTCNSEAPSSNPALNSGSPELNSSATLVNNQLVCLRPVGILNPVMFDLNYLFQSFARSH